MPIQWYMVWEATEKLEQMNGVFTLKTKDERGKNEPFWRFTPEGEKTNLILLT